MLGFTFGRVAHTSECAVGRSDWYESQHEAALVEIDQTIKSKYRHAECQSQRYAKQYRADNWQENEPTDKNTIFDH
jgi:hypothetical protein